MALKFLNKKGWHTGSLRNIENVWKAEQKQAAEEKKLEELRKQIHEERERSEFRQLQEQAGLIPKQERLDFLYESGLAVGKGSSSFQALESLPKNDPGTTAPSSSNATATTSAATAQQPAVPGALFEEKPQSANDAWRKLHSDPLLLIRQKEQEALARVKNNPIQMAMIRKSVEAQKKDGEKKDGKKHHKSKHRRHSSSGNGSDSDNDAFPGKRQSDGYPKYRKSEKSSHRESDEVPPEKADKRKSDYEERKERRLSGKQDHEYRKNRDEQTWKKREYESRHQDYDSERQAKYHINRSEKPPRPESNYRHRQPVKISEDERAARLREMQIDAESHEEQRWKRLKLAADRDAQEAVRDRTSSGRNFLDATQKSVYGTETGGSSTIEESVRRRTHYSQGRSDSDKNAFRR